MVSLQPPSEARWNLSLHDQRVRAILYQILFVGAIVWFAFEIWAQTAENMLQRGIPLSLGFWNETAGFSINQTLIPYTSLSSYGRAFWVGVTNTLLVSVLGIVLATIIGFIVGIARLSPNWIVARVAKAYVEIVRNIPLLLQLLFWYNTVLKPLPAPKNSIELPAGIFLNNRGLIFPSAEFHPGLLWPMLALLIAISASVVIARRARTQQYKTGERRSVLWICFLLLVGLPLIVFYSLGGSVDVTIPELKGFNFKGGHQVYPEFVALLLGLSIYTASFIAEVVRSGIQAVSKGQKEAASALGFSPGLSLRLIVVPQAFRIIIPPMTSQYLNLTKNSSLAVFIGYPDLVHVFAGSVLNQTGAAVQVMAITLLVYLTISLVTSAGMNAFNRHFKIVER